MTSKYKYMAYFRCENCKEVYSMNEAVILPSNDKEEKFKVICRRCFKIGG